MMPAHSAEWIEVSRSVEAVEIPSGYPISLAQGTEVSVTQELGGDFTVRARWGGLYRIDGSDADCIGREVPAQSKLPGELTEENLTKVLKTCYDPEIPVNIVELGLVYESVVQQSPEGAVVAIKMTLTAPGCGMGQVIVNDVKRKVQKLKGVARADVELTFDPPWSPAMMSEAARLQTGMMY